MTTPAGTISLLDVQNEFGGGAPISLSEYYRDPYGLVTANNSGVPQSGAISMSQLRSTTKALAVGTINVQYVDPGFGYGYGYYVGVGGALSPLVWGGVTINTFYSPNTGQTTRIQTAQGWAWNGLTVWAAGGGPYNFYWDGSKYNCDVKIFSSANAGNQPFIIIQY
jgi:hypothetical protein